MILSEDGCTGSDKYPGTGSNDSLFWLELSIRACGQNPYPVQERSCGLGVEIAAHILVGLTPPVKALLLDRREAVESLLKQIVSEHELEICKKDLNFLARMDPDKNSRKKKRAGGNYRTKAEQIAHTVSLCCSLRCFCLTTCLTPCLICFLLICKPVLRL